MTATVDNGTVYVALELRGRAPSVHKAQPWRWRIARAAIHLYAGTERMARTASDIGVTVDCMTYPDEPDLLAVVARRPGAVGVDCARASEQVVAIVVHRSDRRRVGWPPATGPGPPRTARLSSVYEVEDRPSDRLPTARGRSAP